MADQDRLLLLLEYEYYYRFRRTAFIVKITNKAVVSTSVHCPTILNPFLNLPS